jgi:hypothetical protein
MTLVQFDFQKRNLTSGHQNASFEFARGKRNRRNAHRACDPLQTRVQGQLMQKSIRLGSACLSLLVTIQQTATAYAQTIPVPAPKMNVAVVEGEATIHNLREKKTTHVAVLVRDGNRNPMPRASVTFSMPAQGAGGTFSNGAKTLTATTNSDGYAVARGIRSNNIPGPFRIQVEAQHNGQTAATAVTQFNMSVASAKGGSGKVVALLGILGAAAAGGAVAALRNGSSATPQPAAPAPIGITPGPSAVGPPR